MRKNFNDSMKELGKGGWHLIISIPGFGDFFNFADYMMSAIYQVLKGVEENLAKLMEASGLDYIRDKEYSSPVIHQQYFVHWIPANLNAKEFYEKQKDGFDDIEDMINSSEVEKAIEGKSDAYISSFIEALRYNFEHDDGKIKKDAEKEKREWESESRDRQVELLEKWFDPDDDEGADELMSSESAIADMLMLNTKFFEGFLKALQDIQADKEWFNNSSLKDVEDDADDKNKEMGIEYSEGYKYAVRRNKLSSEELKKYYPNKWVEEANVDLSIVERNLNSLEGDEIGSSALETPMEENETRDDITVMKEDIAEMKGNIATITGSIQKLSALFEAPKPKETDEKYERIYISPEDTKIGPPEYPTTILPYMRGEEALVTTPPTESVNLVVEEVRTGFENILNAFTESQTNANPTAGDEKILTVSLTDENANNISTLIVEKLNEEEAAVPAINAVEGVTNEDLGIEARDSMRAIKDDIAENKNILISIIRVVREKALTFNQIYNMFGDRLADDYEKETGRNIRY